MKLINKFIIPLVVVITSLSSVVFSKSTMEVIGRSQLIIHQQKDKIPLNILVKDEKGNPKSGIKINFWLELAPIDATCHINTHEVETNKNGIATVYFTSGNVEGTYRIGAANSELINSPLFFTIILEKKNKEAKSKKGSYTRIFSKELLPLPPLPSPITNISEIKPPKTKDEKLAVRIKKKIEVKPGKPAIIKLYKDKESLIANNEDTTKITAVVLDKFGNKVADGIQVKLKTTTGEFIHKDKRQKEVELTIKDGQVGVLLISSTRAGEATITAEVNDIKEEISISFLPGEISYLTLRPTDVEIKAGETVTLEVHGLDKFNNVVTLKDIKFDVEGKRYQLIGNKFIPEKSGDYKIVAKVGDIQAISKIKVQPSVPSRIILTPKDIPVRVATQNMFIATLEDKYGNPIKDTKLNFEIVKGEGELSKEEITTNEYGKAIVALITAPQVQEYVIRVSTSGITTSTKILSVPDEPNSIELKSDKQTLIADGKSETLITACVRDKYQNIIKEGNITFAAEKGEIITLDSNDKLEGIQVKIINEVTTVTYRSSPKTGVDYVTASIGNITEKLKINLTSGVPTKFSFQLSKNKLVANGEDNAKCEIKVLDEGENLIEEKTEVTVDAKGVEIVAQDENKEKEGIQLVSKAGIVKFDIYSSYKAGEGIITAKCDTAKGMTKIELIPGEVAKLSITPSVVTLPAGSYLKFEVIGYDKYDNKVNITPIFYAGKLGRIDKLTGEYYAEKAGEAEVIAYVGDLKAEAKVKIIPSQPKKLIIKSVEEIIVGEEAKVKAIVYDNYGNPVKDVKLYFTARINNEVIKKDEGLTNEQGECYFEFIVNKIGEVDIEINAPAIPEEKSKGLIQLASLGYTEIFIAEKIILSKRIKLKVKPGEPENIKLKSEKENIIADGQDKVNIEALIYDKFGNLIEDDVIITFSASLGRIITPDLDKEQEGIQVKSKQGRCKITLQAPIKIGESIITCVYEGIKETTKVPIVSCEPEVIKIYIDKDELPADGQSKALIEVLVFDRFFNKIRDGTIITLSATQGVLEAKDKSETIPGIQLLTKDGKVKTYIISSTSTGIGIIKAQIDDVKAQKEIKFIPGELSYIVTYPSKVILRAGEVQKFRCQAYDKNSNLIGEIKPTWGIIGEGEIDEKGNFLGKKKGEVIIIASYNDKFAQAKVEVIEGAPFKLKPIYPTTSSVKDEVEIKTYLLDEFDNGIPNCKIKFQSLTKGSEILHPEVITNKEGLASTKFILSPIAGLNKLKIYYGNLSKEIDIKGEPLSPSFIYLSSSPTYIIPAIDCVISAKVKDKFKNFVADKTEVVFTTTAGYFKETQTTIITKETTAGIATATLSLPAQIDTVTVVAKAEGTSPVELTLSSKPPVVIERPSAVKEEPTLRLPPEARRIDKLGLKEADIRTVLQLLSQKSGLNIVADESVKDKKVTLQLANLPVPEALHLIMEAYNLDYKKIGNSYIVFEKKKEEETPPPVYIQIIPLKASSADEVKNIITGIMPEGQVLVDKRTNSIIIKGKKHEVDTLTELVSKLDTDAKEYTGFITQLFTLEYAEPDAVVTALKDAGIGTSPGTVVSVYKPEAEPRAVTGAAAGAGAGIGGVVHPMSSAKKEVILVKDTRANVKLAEEIIKSIDKPPKRVMLEVRIEEIETTALKNLGIEWSKDFPVVFDEKNPAGKMGLQAFSRTSLTINALLKALEEKGLAKTLSSPKISTVDGKQAVIHIGDTIYYKTTTVADGKITYTWAPINVGIVLNITPRITSDNRIATDIFTSVTTPTIKGPEMPPDLHGRTASTFMVIKEGETIIIGGLISTKEIENIYKVPFLGDLPILGDLFKSKSKENRNTELVIFLTPYII